MEIIDIDKKYTNKVLITGNKFSGFGMISDILEQTGIPYATSIKSDKVDIENIGKVILSSSQNKKRLNLLEPVKVSKVWDSLILDLYLENITKDVWQWKDENAIYLLDYFKSLDENLSFILVYNDPKSMLLKYIEENKIVKPKKVDSLLNSWHRENKILLDFFYSNRDRALLVNSSEFLKTNKKKIARISKTMGIPLSSNLSLQSSVKEQEMSTKSLEGSPLFSYLMDKLTEEYPSSLELYDEIQSVANVYYTSKSHKKRNAKKAFCDAVNLNYRNSMLSEEEKERLLTQLHQVQEELERYYENNTKIRQEKESLEKEFNRKILKEKQSISEEKQEKELLLTQLHQVQEELERYYLENQKLKVKKESKRYYGAGERIKSELPYKIGVEITTKAKSPMGLLLLPISLLRLKSQYKKDSIERLKKEGKLPSLDVYADAYEAERVKRHLNYRVGKTTIETMKNPLGIFLLPFRLLATRRAFHKEKVNR